MSLGTFTETLKKKMLLLFFYHLNDCFVLEEYPSISSHHTLKYLQHPFEIMMLLSQILGKETKA